MVLFLVTASCSAGADEGAETKTPAAPPADTAVTAAGGIPSTARLFPPAPEVPTGPFDPGTIEALEAVWSELAVSVDSDEIRALGATGDARVAWLIADLMRFVGIGSATEAAKDALAELTGVRFDALVPWVAVTDHLIAWDLPAPPEYVDYKRRLFTTIDDRWEFVFIEPNAIDERVLSWGGVFIDDRPLGSTVPCPSGCIPALDDPAVTTADGGDWYGDEEIVFGIVINGEARAYPRHMMEVHEMVNDTLGGRRIGIPYCTLCGSAQAFFLDDVAGFDEPVLRTSGLLSRSNKVMFDLTSMSVFDTFTGDAVAGPMFRSGITLQQTTVVTSTWGAWKDTHPRTTILAEDGGVGRTYDRDPLGGRDDQGPIFPIGARDLRLPVQESVLGVVLADGTPVAFPVEPAKRALQEGAPVSLAGITLHLQGDGIRAEHDGTAVPSHQAFWFAWSQFHPDTLLWEEK
jgi:hypothetical protein